MDGRAQLYPGAKIFGSDKSGERLSAAAMKEIRALGFNKQDIDVEARYMLFDLTPYEDMARHRPDVQAMRDAWREFAGSEDGPLIWSADGGRFLVDMYYVNNHRSEIPMFEIFDGHMPASPRATRVASTLIEWLGTNMGTSLIQDCEWRYMHVTGLTKAEVYEVCWSQQEHAHGNRPDQERLARKFLEATGATEYMDARVMQRVMHWLGTDKGQALLAQAMPFALSVKKPEGVNLRRSL